MPTVLYGVDFDRATEVMAGPGEILQREIARAIATERERCALVVENMGRSNGRVRKSHRVIADEIRSAKNRIGKQR